MDLRVVRNTWTLILLIIRRCASRHPTQTFSSNLTSGSPIQQFNVVFMAIHFTIYYAKCRLFLVRRAGSRSPQITFSFLCISSSVALLSFKAPDPDDSASVRTQPDGLPSAYAFWWSIWILFGKSVECRCCLLSNMPFQYTFSPSALTLTCFAL